MIIGLKDNYPLLNKSLKQMAKCRLCNSTMIGVYDWNMRFYCDCCDSEHEIGDVYPRKKPLKVWSPV